MGYANNLEAGVGTDAELARCRSSLTIGSYRVSDSDVDQSTL